MTQSRFKKWLALFLAVFSALVLFFGTGKKYFGFVYDPHNINCLPELHLALGVFYKPTKIEHGDYLFWLPGGSLSYVKQDYVLKKVAGVPGDHLVIKDAKVYINGQMVVEGLENAPFYHKTPAQFELDQMIPANSYFMIGTRARSDDSRYWGYLHYNQIVGHAYRLW